MMEFQVGDCVEAIRNHPDGNPDIKIGDLGTVCRVSDNIGVNWGKPIQRGHDCGHTCKHGLGWYVGRNEIRLYEPEGAIDIEEDSFMRMLGGSK